MTAKVPSADAPAELKEGVQVQLSNGLQATVAEVTPEHVIIDANHVLAGKDLNFEVELIKLQKVQFLSVCSQQEHTRCIIAQGLHAMHSVKPRRTAFEHGCSSLLGHPAQDIDQAPALNHHY